MIYYILLYYTFTYNLRYVVINFNIILHVWRVLLLYFKFINNIWNCHLNFLGTVRAFSYLSDTSTGLGTSVSILTDQWAVTIFQLCKLVPLFLFIFKHVLIHCLYEKLEIEMNLYSVLEIISDIKYWIDSHKEENLITQ